MIRTPALRILSLLVVLGLLAAACGGSNDESQDEDVATLQENQEETDTPEDRQDVEDAVLEFSQCMRDEGIDIPDIELDATGAPILDEAAIEGVDLESDAFRNAFTGCIGFITDASASSFDFDPRLEAIIQDQLTEFAACMRREGIADFPDPVIGSSGTPFPLSAFTNFGDPDFSAALETCQQESSFAGLTP